MDDKAICPLGMLNPHDDVGIDVFCDSTQDRKEHVLVVVESECCSKRIYVSLTPWLAVAPDESRYPVIVKAAGIWCELGLALW